MVFAPLSVGRRLALGFSALVILLVVVAVFGALEFRAMGGRMRQIVEVNNTKSDLAYQMLDDINRMAVQTRSITLLTDLKEIEAEAKVLKAAEAGYWQTQQALGNLLQASGEAEERKLFDELGAAAKTTIPLVLDAARQGQEGANTEATMTLTLQVRPNEAVWRAKVERLVALEKQASAAAYAQAQARETRALVIAAAVVVAAAFAGVVIGWRITRSVRLPIERAMRVAERIAEGDLTSAVPVASRDEIGRMLAAVAAMQERLRSVVGEIRQSAQSIQGASAEVASGNQNLSQRTELAASSLQQTASSMEELTATVQQSAHAAVQANQLASQAHSVAARGGEVVAQVVATMGEINDSSKKIADIIGVIDGIAFQTNILALNAAVEAARAGEQGRGFAVVAGEVRNLAQRSAEAAKEIKALIGSSVDKVESGSKLVADAGATMNEIVASVQRVTDIIGEITAAASEQSEGIGQVNTAVTQLDQMTQQN
ncbi:MAG TPA: methyl-accepting chemotaxis protein, partial [Albitalea sp.]|nr:methyl-accepting chemotaxis protein [Albitalea sp.]